jgi:hypothetical protein
MSADYGRVVVTDIMIPFTSMVILMNGWAVSCNSIILKDLTLSYQHPGNLLFDNVKLGVIRTDLLYFTG